MQTVNLEGLVLKNRYRIGKQLGAGSFGAFHIGEDTKNGKGIAIKVEAKSCPQPQLHIEYNNYTVLNAGKNVPKFIPKVFFYDQINTDYDALVMELFGPSLKKMTDICGGKFSITTTTQVLMQLTNIMEYVHDRKILYRDVKPDNFLIGLPSTNLWCTIILIGLFDVAAHC